MIDTRVHTTLEPEVNATTQTTVPPLKVLFATSKIHVSLCNFGRTVDLLFFYVLTSAFSWKWCCGKMWNSAACRPIVFYHFSRLVYDFDILKLVAVSCLSCCIATNSKLLADSVWRANVLLWTSIQVLWSVMRATKISSWVNLTVSGQPSERQLINCWIRAPPLGGGDHVTKRLTLHIRLSLGAKSLLPVVLEIGRLPVIIIFVLLYICAYYTTSSSSVSWHHHSTHRTFKLSNLH